jgi:hypothetical protein
MGDIQEEMDEIMAEMGEVPKKVQRDEALGGPREVQQKAEHRNRRKHRRSKAKRPSKEASRAL